MIPVAVDITPPDVALRLLESALALNRRKASRVLLLPLPQELVAPRVKRYLPFQHPAVAAAVQHNLVLCPSQRRPPATLVASTRKKGSG